MGSLTSGGVDLEQTQVGIGYKQRPVGSDSDPQRPPAVGLVLSGTCWTSTNQKGCKVCLDTDV